MQGAISRFRPVRTHSGPARPQDKRGERGQERLAGEGLQEEPFAVGRAGRAVLILRIARHEEHRNRQAPLAQALEEPAAPAAPAAFDGPDFRLAHWLIGEAS